MEVSLGATDSGLNFSNSLAIASQQQQSDLLIIESITPSSDSDSVAFSFQDLYKSLSVESKKIIDAINEQLKVSLPDGVQSLSPDQVTPEATAEKIVSGTTAFFSVFQDQNPDLQGEDLLNAFMKTIRGGIDSGYDDAVKTLEGLGAFEFDGVQDGVKQTKSLIESKLVAFEKQMRQQMGLDPKDPVAEASAVDIKNAVLTQAGAQSLNISA